MPKRLEAKSYARIAAAFAIVVAALLAGAGSAAERDSAHSELSPDLLKAVVRIATTVAPDARTAPYLGTKREGSGVVIDADGLILTIGYLVTEAMSAEITGPSGKPVLATVIGFDTETGLGLLRASEPLGVKPIRLGRSAKLAEKQPALVASADGVQGVQVVSRRTFAGYWEYLLEDAIFTTPPYGDWGGAALIDAEGTLVGVGSLLVPNAGGEGQPGNMFVPIDSLKPAFADLLARGRPGGPPRPWLGLNLAPAGVGLVVVRVSEQGPAQKAGLHRGDRILAVAGQPVTDLAEFYRRVWAQGQAGVSVPLTVEQDGDRRDVQVLSVDRYRYLKLDTTY